MKYFIEVLHKKKLISNSDIEHFELKTQTEKLSVSLPSR